MGIGPNAAGIATQAERLVSAVGKSFTPKAWKSAAETAARTTERAATSSGFWSGVGGVFGSVASGIGSVLTSPFKVAFAVGRWFVEAPISLLILKPIKAILGGFAGFFERSPRAASILTGGAAAVGIGSWLTKRRSEARMFEYDVAQNAAMQAVAMKEAATQQAQPAYGLAPGEYPQNVEPLMRGGDGQARTDHAAAVASQRAAAATQAPDAAKTAAL